MNAEQQGRLAANIFGSLGQARPDVQMRQLCHFLRADMNYGRQIAAGLGINIDESMLQGPQPIPSHAQVGG